MKKLQVFISSVQSEFADERKALADYLRNDPLLGTFFEPFIFEEVPANTHHPGAVYLKEVKDSAVYIGLLGKQYGYEDKEGISPTEHEYDKAKSENIQRWIYIKYAEPDARHPKEKAFIRKIEQDVSRKKFSDIDSLKKAVFHSAVVFLKQTGKITSTDFDNSLNERATINDIDQDMVRDFVISARDKRNFPIKETAGAEEVLAKLKMLRENKLVNSSLLVFNPEPQQFFPSATIKCAHFHGTQIQKPIPDYKEFGGNVYTQANEAVDFILSKISVSTGTREKSNIVETLYEVPRRVIAEAVINAVAHRDYYSKASIQVSVFKDRIEISNPGSLPPELEIEDLKKSHSSYPHNPLLADCLFQTGAIERYGTGTIEIFELTKKRGLIDPLISLDEGFKVTIWRPAADTDHDTDHDTDYDTDYDTDQATGKSRPGYREVPNLTHRLVIVIIGEMSRQELMDKLELKHIPTFRANYINPAIDDGLIEMTIPDKLQSKDQKYRLTGKGKKMQKQLLKELK